MLKIAPASNDTTPVRKTHPEGWRRKGGAQTSVYFMQAGEGGPIKIGLTNCVANRLRYIQTGQPCEIELLGSVTGGKDLEEALHVRFAADRLRGEWFKDTPELRAVIEKLCPTVNGMPKWKVDMGIELGEIVDKLALDAWGPIADQPEFKKRRRRAA